MHQKPVIVVGIPAFNEEKTIARVVLGSLKFTNNVIVVDDGSNDLTGEIARKLGAKVIHHQNNLGKGEALRALFRTARKMNADILVTLDADGQHLPSEIPVVLAPVIEQGIDISIGSRILGSSYNMPKYRKFGSSIINSLVKSISDLPIKDTESGFRAYSKRVLSNLLPSEMGMGTDSTFLAQANESGFSIIEVPIKIVYDKDVKTSKHNPLYHALDVLASIFKHLSIRHPLLFFGIPGTFFLILAFIFGFLLFETYTTYHYFSTNYGVFAFVSFSIGTMLVTNGVQLFTIITVLRRELGHRNDVD